jgi:zinc protease
MSGARSVGARAGASSALCAGLAAWVACSSAAPSAATPSEARPGAEQRPPRVARALGWSGPELGQARLANGLGVRLWERRGLPLVELRLVISSGTASELDHPGAASFTTAALGPGTPIHPAAGELVERVESLGGRLNLQTARDAASLSLTLPRSALDEGLPLLAALSVHPRWTAAEFELLRRREMTRVSSLQRTSPSWAGAMALYAELFRASPRRHPYARFDALLSDLERLTPEDCTAWYDANVSPKNAFLLVVGDTTLAQLLPLAQQALGNWQGKEVAPPLFFTPAPPTRLKTLLVDRPNSRVSELRIATLLPERRAAVWSRLAVANQILGGAGPSRLRRDLTQRGELEPRASSSLEEVAYGATPLVISAQASTERTASTLESLLESFSELSQREPGARELRQAIEQLATDELWRLETSSSAADLLSQTGVMGLPVGALDAFRRDLSRVTATEVRAAALRHLSSPPVVVVVGDAARLLTPLSHFGQVHVLNPSRDFQVERVVTQDPTAPLELLPVDP